MVTGRRRNEASRLGLPARVAKRMLVLEVPPGQASEHGSVVQNAVGIQTSSSQHTWGRSPRCLEQSRVACTVQVESFPFVLLI